MVLTTIEMTPILEVSPLTSYGGEVPPYSSKSANPAWKRIFILVGMRKIDLSSKEKQKLGIVFEK